MSIVQVTALAFAVLIFIHFFAAAYGIKKSKQIKGDKVLCGISVIKPVKGIDADAYQNFKSFCEQEVAVPYQLIFSLQDPDDQALPLLEELKKEYLQLDIQIIINPVKKFLTGKSSNLYYGMERAKYDCLVLSDADMYVKPDFLTRIASQLNTGNLGVVSALPIHIKPQGFWAWVYQLQLNATILAQWLPYASIFKLGVAGGTIAIKREVLESIGGVEAFGGYVAEDVRIGLLVREAGYQVAVGPEVYSAVGSKTLEDLVSLLARGTLIYRRMLNTALELPYLIVAYFYFPLTVLGVFSAAPLFFKAAGIHLGGKVLTAFLISRRAGTSGLEAFLLPVLDTVFILTYINTLRKGSLTWRGITYRVDQEGKMISLN